MSTETKSPTKLDEPDPFATAPHLEEWVPRLNTRPHRDTCPAKLSKDATCVCGGISQ